MRQENINWRHALIALAAVTLFVAGTAIIIYVSIARNRLMPTPTPVESTPLPLASATLREPTWTPVQPKASATPVPLTSVIGVVRDYPPGALIILLTPREGNIEQVIVPDNVVVT